jgi:thiamine-monophosphate kinase
VGSVHPRRLLRRDGARAGDELFVTGSLGAAAAGLEQLRSAREGSRESPCAVRYARPEPRIRVGLLAARNQAATAAMDLSDGLSDAVAQIARASGTGAVIEADTLPIEPGARAWFEARGADPVAAALTGGEDYELLLSVRPRNRGRLRGLRQLARGVPITRVGRLTRDTALRLLRGGREEPLPAGYEHFAHRMTDET